MATDVQTGGTTTKYVQSSATHHYGSKCKGYLLRYVRPGLEWIFFLAAADIIYIPFYHSISCIYLQLFSYRGLAFSQPVVSFIFRILAPLWQQRFFGQRLLLRLSCMPSLNYLSVPFWLCPICHTCVYLPVFLKILSVTKHASFYHVIKFAWITNFASVARRIQATNRFSGFCLFCRALEYFYTVLHVLVKSL